MDPWSYIAPSSGNIINSIEEFSEDYFKTDHEGVSCQDKTTSIGNHSTPSTQIKIKQEVITPICEEDVYEVRCVTPPVSVIKTEKFSPDEEAANAEIKRKQRRRRSMSVCAVMETTDVVSHVTVLSHGIEKVHLSSSHEYTSHNKGKKICDVSTTKSIKSMSSASSHTNLNTAVTKFVSLAEAIYHLQKDTPERFHSYSRKHDMQGRHNSVKNFGRRAPCIPQSPALMSKTRNRNIKILSQKDIEDIEYEELKNYRIKANPVPKSVIFGTSNMPIVERRELTKPVPFNLTQVTKKPPPPAKKIVFTAKPAPKHILEKPVDLPKKTVRVTVPKSPKLSSRVKSRSMENMGQPALIANSYQIKKGKNPLQVSMDGGLPDQGGVGHSGVPLAQKTTLHPCKPKPFSFEERDKEMIRKKEEKIRMVFEEERRLREFHANPIPNIMKKVKGGSPKSKVFEKKQEIKKDNKENEVDEHNQVFKARPPVVLFKSPFRPVKKERPVLEPCQVQLTTEVRAHKRNEFNQALREKEEQLEQLKKKQEEERLRREEAERAALRSQLVHKAAPVRHYQPVVIHPSEVPLTKPESPKFHLLHK